LWLAGLGELKNSMTSSGIEAGTFRLVAECLNYVTTKRTLNFYIADMNLSKVKPFLGADWVPIIYNSSEPYSEAQGHLLIEGN
jgi:hypothetical protein